MIWVEALLFLTCFCLTGSELINECIYLIEAGRKRLMKGPAPRSDGPPAKPSQEGLRLTANLWHSLQIWLFGRSDKRYIN